jgi:hypothetical protein
MSWFWVHTGLSVLFGVCFFVAGWYGYLISGAKKDFGCESLPPLIKKHVHAGWPAVFFGVLTLISSGMLGVRVGVSAEIHNFVPVPFFIFLLTGTLTGVKLSRASGSVPLLHVFAFGAVAVCTILQFITGAVFLFDTLGRG